MYSDNLLSAFSSLIPSSHIKISLPSLQEFFLSLCTMLIIFYLESDCEFEYGYLYFNPFLYFVSSIRSVALVNELTTG